MLHAVMHPKARQVKKPHYSKLKKQVTALYVYSSVTQDGTTHYLNVRLSKKVDHQSSLKLKSQIYGFK